jgi:HD domain
LLLQEATLTISNLSSALVIPDSLLAKEATGILREYSSDLLFNHSVRVYLFAAEQGRQQRLRFDAELLYVAAAFHDLGLIKKFSSQDEWGGQPWEPSGAPDHPRTSWQPSAILRLIEAPLSSSPVLAGHEFLLAG